MFVMFACLEILSLMFGYPKLRLDLRSPIGYGDGGHDLISASASDPIRRGLEAEAGIGISAPDPPDCHPYV